MIKLITEQIDVLAFLKPDRQSFGSQSRITDWTWLDYTHHRWTGDFGKALVRRALSDQRSRVESLRPRVVVARDGECGRTPVCQYGRRRAVS